MSLLVNSSEGDLVGLQFKQEMSTAEMRVEENNINAFWEESAGTWTINKVGVFDVWHNFLKEIMFNYSSDPAHSCLTPHFSTGIEPKGNT